MIDASTLTISSAAVDIFTSQNSSALSTVDTYTQSVTPAKRETQDAVIRLLIANDQSTSAAPA
jgi:hypothetical protein